MRLLFLLASLTLAAPIAAVAQTDMPAGTRFIADSGTREYFPLSCALASGVPPTRRLYYGTEDGVQEDGFQLARGCAALRLQDAGRLPPRAVQPAAAEVEAPNRHVREGFWLNAGL